MAKVSLFLFLIWSGPLLADLLPLPPPIQNPPPLSNQKKAESEITFFHIDYIGRTLKAHDWYRLALLLIEARQWEKAWDALDHSTNLDPNFDLPYVQKGYLFLWDGNENKASEAFRTVLERTPCEGYSIEGIQRIGVKWSFENGRLKQAISLLREADGCRPNDPVTLYYLGGALLREGSNRQAQEVLEQLLSMRPDQLDAQLMLGLACERQGNCSCAESIFRNLQGEPDAARGLARCLNRDLRFTEAKEMLSNLNAKSDRDFALLMDVRSHTNPALFIESSYTMAKEDDPTLGVAVVKDYYFYNGVSLRIPIVERWRIDMKQIYYHQRENEIIAPTGTNYNVFLGGGQATSRLLFASDWEWDLVLRYLRSWSKGGMTFPYQKRAPFEPGTTLSYHGQTQSIWGDAHVESMIIKNFDIGKSQLLRLDFMELGYGFSPNWKLDPEVRGWVNGTYYHDSIHNWKNQQILDFSAGLPFLGPYIRLLFRFEHANFKRLTPNYFTYLRQIENWVGGRLRIEITDWSSLDVEYIKSWQHNTDVILPIGSLIFISPQLNLNGDRVTGRLWMRFRDHFRFEIEGHYFRNTLPYRDWNLRGNLLWQF